MDKNSVFRIPALRVHPEVSSVASAFGVYLNNAEAVGTLAEHNCAWWAIALDSFETQKKLGAL